MTSTSTSTSIQSATQMKEEILNKMDELINQYNIVFEDKPYFKSVINHDLNVTSILKLKIRQYKVTPSLLFGTYKHKVKVDITNVINLVNHLHTKLSKPVRSITIINYHKFHYIEIPLTYNDVEKKYQLSIKEHTTIDIYYKHLQIIMRF